MKDVDTPESRILGGIVLLVWGVILTAGPVIAQEDSTFQEDPQRHLRAWEERLSPEEYQLAYDSAGHEGASVGLRYPFDWEPVGPIGKQGWEEIQGRVNAIATVDDGSGSYDIYVGACGGSLWKSAETPVEWTDIGSSLPNPSIGAVGVEMDNHDIIRVGSGVFGRYPGSGMYETTNGGLNWNLVSLPVWAGWFRRIIDLDVPDGVWIAACGGGILRLGAGGWTLEHSGWCTDLVVDPTDPDRLYACACDPATDVLTVYRSTNGGATWSKIPNAPSCFETSGDPDFRHHVRGSIAICQTSPCNLAVILAYRDGGNPDEDKRHWTLAGVWRSTDCGVTWDDISTGQVAVDGLGWDQLFHAQAIAIRPQDPDNIFVGGIYMAITYDGGDSWAIGLPYTPYMNLDTGHADIAELYFRPGDNNTLWILNDGGLFIRDLSKGTTISYNGDQTSGLNCLQVDFMDAERAFWTLGLLDDGMFTTTDGGGTWQHHGSSDAGDMEITDNEEHKWWYSVGAPFIIRRQTLSGWTEDVSGLPYNEYVPKFFFDRYSEQIYTYDSAYIYSGDAPEGSPTISSVFHLNPFDIGKSGIWGDYVDGKTLYATYWEGSQISVCRKSGGNWSCTEYDLVGPCGRVGVVTASPQNTREAWAGLVSGPYEPKLLHTEDNWQTWEDISGSLKYVGAVHAIVVTPFNEDQLFVATDLGVFWTQDGGASWFKFNEGMCTAVACHDMRYIIDTLHIGFDKLVVATFGRGVHQRTILGPPIVFVDKRNVSGVEDGTIDHPFNTLDEGISYAPPGAIVAIHADTYPVPVPSHVDKQLRFESYESSALIGVGK